MAKELTPNAEVSYIEGMAFKLASVAYSQYLRDLVIEKIDDAATVWDDRVLAMFDALFNIE